MQRLRINFKKLKFSFLKNYYHGFYTRSKFDMVETHGFDGIKLRGNYMSNPMIDILNHHKLIMTARINIRVEMRTKPERVPKWAKP